MDVAQVEADEAVGLEVLRGEEAALAVRGVFGVGDDGDGAGFGRRGDLGGGDFAVCVELAGEVPELGALLFGYCFGPGGFCLSVRRW